MNQPSIIRIATRQSPLALWQATEVKQRLEEAHPMMVVEIIPLITEGDRHLEMPLFNLGGKSLFVKELEHALLTKRADIAVHSMKDVPMEFPKGLALAAISEREDPRDVFISNDHATFDGLPTGATVGTSSLRRQCQLRALRPDIKVQALRGNVNSRLRRLDEGEFDAIVLAAAGLLRLQLSARINHYFTSDQCLPAVGQGAIGIEYRCGEEALQKIVSCLNHENTWDCVMAERAMSRHLGAGCQAPVAGYAELHDLRLQLRGVVGQPDGSQLLKEAVQGHVSEAESLGIALAERLLARGAGDILFH